MAQNRNAPPSNGQKIVTLDSKLILPKPFDNVTGRSVRKDPMGFVTTFLGIEADTCEVIETETNSVDESQKIETLADFAILGGLIYGSKTIWNAVVEGTVQESSVIQDLSKKWIQQGIERGQKLQAREAILTFLTARFQTDAVETLKPLIEAISELEHLNQLNVAAAKADSLEDFRNVLLNINT